MAKTEGPKEYQAQCDLRTMIEYQKIMKDAGRRKAAMAARDKEMEALKSAGEKSEQK